jgi:hypothetical protein
MISTFSNNKFVIVIAVLLIAGALWYGFSGSSESSSVLGTENPAGEVNSEDQDLVATLLKLRSVTLTGTIFSSPVFLVLKDFSTEITEEPVGRVDPFAMFKAPASQSGSGINNASGASLFNRPGQ